MSFKIIKPAPGSLLRYFLQWLVFPGEGKYSFVFGAGMFMAGLFCASFIAGAGVKAFSVETSVNTSRTISSSLENHPPKKPASTEDTEPAMGGPLEPASGDSLSETDFQDDTLGELKKYSYTIDEHDNLYTALQCFGVSQKRILSWCNLSKDKYNLARLRPGQSLSLYKDASSNFTRFELNINKSQRLVISREEDDKAEYVAYIETFESEELDSSEESPFNRPHPLWVDPETGYHYYRGTVKKTFYQSAMDAGMTPSKIMSVIYVFGEIDFDRSLKPGSKFSILVGPGNLVGEEGPILAGRFEIGDDIFWTFRFEDKGKVGYYNERGESAKRNGLLCPLKYSRISSGYTHRRLHPILKVYRPHLGIDYAAPSGTPVKAATDGVVVHAGRKGGFGRTVVIKHDSGFKTLYGHLSRYAKRAKKGRRVSRGQVIGYVGESGLATGPHLDYRVYKNGKPMNPRKVTGIPQPPVGDTRGFKHKMRKMKLELTKELPMGPARPWPPQEKKKQVADSGS